MIKKITLILLFYFAAVPSFGELGNRFVLGRLDWSEEPSQNNPYPLAFVDILDFLARTTSLQFSAGERAVNLNSPELWRTPFLLMAGSGLWTPSEKEKENLRLYLLRGGFLFVEDRSLDYSSLFDSSLRRVFAEIFPADKFFILPREHAAYRSFYLLRGNAGRKIFRSYFEGLDLSGRTAVIYSQNDVLGAWAKDRLGNYLYHCEPGGEAQRWESQKFLINAIVFSVTGTYKTDPIHLPFIEEKLKRP